MGNSNFCLLFLFLPASHVVCGGLCGWTLPWLVFLFPGGVPCLGCQALYHAGQCWVPPVYPGKTAKEIWRRDCKVTGESFRIKYQVTWISILFFLVRFSNLLLKIFPSHCPYQRSPAIALIFRLYLLHAFWIILFKRFMQNLRLVLFYLPHLF